MINVISKICILYFIVRFISLTIAVDLFFKVTKMCLPLNLRQKKS